MAVDEVGCGKTSLISALLGNLACVQGRAALRSDLKIAYVMQRAFIVAGTIEECSAENPGNSS
eukprot:5374432-Amphidinium_carterae.1